MNSLKDEMFIQILEVTKEGATKKQIMDKIPGLSPSQLRKYTAELADKNLIHYDEGAGRYITTDRGIKYVNSKRT